MIKKKLLSMSLISMLVISMAMLAGVKAYTPPYTPPGIWFYTEPDPKTIGPTDADVTGSTFTIDVKIDNNGTSIQGWEFKLGYNATLINATGISKGLDPVGTLWGPLGDPPGYPWIPLLNASDGFVFVQCAYPLGQAQTIDILCVTITFQVMLAPPRELGPPATKSVSCNLDLYETVIGNPAGGGEDHGADDGFYEYIRNQIMPGEPILPDPPIWTPLFPNVCDEVTVDASATDPNGVGDSITLWNWTLTNTTGQASWTDVGNKSIVKFHCDGPGDVTVTLYVEDNQGMNKSRDYVIPQVLLAGPQIDLFTQNYRQYPEGTITPYDGTGFYQDCDSFAPGENVSLWAYVTYNGEPVQNILVGFEVLDPLNRCVTYRVCRTNETGYAQVWFRVPIPCSPAEQLELFGHWWVMAKCKLQDDIIDDIMRFKVGFIIEIPPGGLIPLQSPLIKGEMACFNVTLKNIAWVSRNVTVIVVVYDECDVPIGQVILEFEMPAADHVLCSSIEVTKTLCITVPKWAYVGIGHVYANAFTDLPQNCGVPYCPEVSISIQINPAP